MKEKQIISSEEKQLMKKEKITLEYAKKVLSNEISLEEAKEICKNERKNKAKKVAKRTSTVACMVLQGISFVIIAILFVLVLSVVFEETGGTAEEQLGRGCAMFFLIALYLPVMIICLIVNVIFGISNITATQIAYKENKKTKLVNTLVSSILMGLSVIFTALTILFLYIH